MSRKYFSIAALAKETGSSEKTLRLWRDMGWLKADCVAGRTRLLYSIDAWEHAKTLAVGGYFEGMAQTIDETKTTGPKNWAEQTAGRLGFH